MFARKFVILNLIVHVIIVLSYVDVTYTLRCSRIPEGSGARRSQSTGNFRLRLSDDSNVYKPGRQYTIFLERNSNAIRSRDRPRPSFTGFFVAVEQKNNVSSTLTEEFSRVKHGTFKVDQDNTLVKLICGNVVTHTSETTKGEIYVNWTAPEPGSGCVIFRATVIEHRDVWYMDDGPLTKTVCEDEATQEDIISNIQEECCACYEAKYEITFEGLWSRNTHPKDFPRNVYTTKFGDIIGATHTLGNSFWARGHLASDGLKEVAEMGITRTLESELKNKSDGIRTIIKARGLSHPNITGKTFAVFRVDSEHHLVSFVSMISPSPDWFVGVSSLELCLPDCTWLESKVVDLYPWDAGTDKGVTYDAPDQPSRPPEYISRITSESPNNIDSPFYSANGSKMKPLARLTLLRQRLYEKNCTADQAASDDCQVGEYSAWGECTGAVCGGTGKQYRQRYYKHPEKATKCHRKLFETKTCIMPNCTYENEDYGSYDPNCESKGDYTDWTPCHPKCKENENDVGKRRKKLVWKDNRSQKECGLRDKRPKILEEECEIEMCVGGNQNINTDQSEATESTDAETTTEAEKTEKEETPEQLDAYCRNVLYRNTPVHGKCEGICGTGKRQDIKYKRDPKCRDHEPIITISDCQLPKPCRNKDFCTSLPDKETCEQSEKASNFIFYNATSCLCSVFTTVCTKQEETNIFESFEECTTACPEDPNNCSGGDTGGGASKSNNARPYDRRNRYKNK